MNRPIHIALLLLVVIAPMSAQFEQLYENWRWAHFTTKAGLPSNTVDEILQANDGTVYVSTLKGIAWYDGFRWNSLSIDSSSQGERATKISKGLNDEILVVHDEKLFRGNANGLKRVSSSVVEIDRVISAVMFQDSLIAISTYNADRPFLFYNYRSGTVQVRSYPSGNIRRTKSNKVFIGNSNGLFELKLQSIEPVIPHGFVRSVSENDRGMGVLSMDSPYDKIGVWEWRDGMTPRLSGSERSLPIRTLDISSVGEVIVAYETGDIRIRLNDKWRSLKPVPTPMIGLNYLFFDKNDNIWVGSEHGVYFFRRNTKKWSWWRYGFSDPRNVVMEIVETASGDIWIGHMNGVEVHKKNGAIDQITSINGKSLGLVTGISEDNDGNIWISSGSSFKGAYQWNGRSWRHYGAEEGLKGPKIHKIRKDKKGNLWFLSLPDRGEYLDTLHTKLGAFKYDGKSFVQYSKESGLIDGRIYSFSEANDSVQWFGTKMGLSQKNPTGWKHWTKDDLKRLSSVYAIDTDLQGNLWFSTFSSVLGFISQDGVTHWEWDWVTDSDYKQKVWDIKVDSSGIVWVATTKGLFSYNNGVWSNYAIESEFGLKELRVVLPTTNKVYVGGHGIGVGILERDKIKVPIQISIEKPIVETNRAYIQWTVDVYWREMSSDDIEVRYKLDDEPWSEWNVGREIEFKAMHSGDHRFILQAKDLYGNIDNSIAESRFTVPPPFYRNIWIVLPFVSLIIVIILLLIRNKQQAERHKNIIREQRTRIANDLHDEVGSNLASIALISKRLWKDESLPAFLRNELDIIRETAAQTGDFLRDIVWYINPQYDSFMSLETRLREIAGRMLRDLAVQIDMNNTGGDNEPFVESRRNIILMFKEIVHNIVKHAQASFVIIRCERNRDLFRLTVKDNGVGFHQEVTRSGTGLLSLKRRARDAGAELTITSKLGEGTTISITFMSNVPAL